VAASGERTTQPAPQRRMTVSPRRTERKTKDEDSKKNKKVLKDKKTYKKIK